jgi:hypothetical protein
MAFKEFRALRKTLEIGIDSYREINRFPKLFAKEEAAEPLRAGQDPTPGKFLRPGDFLSVDMIMKLAEEYRIPVDVETDIEQLAIDRGWVNEKGEFVVLPAGFEGRV